MIASGKRRGVPPLFAPAGPLTCWIGPALVPIRQPRVCCRARGPPEEGPDQDRDGIKSAGAAHHSVPGHAAGPAVGTRQPSGKPSSSPEPTDQGDLVVISIVFIKAVRKSQNGHFSGGITPDSGKWSAPAANEVAP
jgi:hypothetical protein